MKTEEGERKKKKKPLRRYDRGRKKKEGGLPSGVAGICGQREKKGNIYKARNTPEEMLRDSGLRKTKQTVHTHT